MRDTLSVYLRKYRELQDKILLVYHPTNDSYWTDRCFYLDEKYDPHKEYNHRWTLHDEIVIEFDHENWKQNLADTEAICKRLEQDNIPYALWHSGNKSYHVHFFIDSGRVPDIALLKKTILRYYSVGGPLPDLQLASPNHLIRAEHGIHEKTGKRKALVRKSPKYPVRATLVPGVWTAYVDERRRVMARRLTHNSGSLLDHPGIKYILTTHQFREAQDGRERALFMLIHLLKPQYKTKEELTEAVQMWYRYSSTKPGLSDLDVARKVDYHYNRTYTITETMVEDFLESIGKKELCRSSEPRV